MEIRPDVWLCNGVCYFSATIYTRNGDLIAFAGSEGGKNELGARFDKPVLQHLAKIGRAPPGYDILNLLDN